MRARGVWSLVFSASGAPADGADRASRADWIALAKSGFALPDGRDGGRPARRDERAARLHRSRASRRCGVQRGRALDRRDGRVAPDELRRLLQLWVANLEDGLGAPGDDRVFKRSFSALCLSLVAARDLTAPFLDAAEVAAFFDRTLDYFARERDLRGFDPVRGWMHTRGAHRRTR